MNGFSATASDLDLRNAYWLARAAQVAYQAPGDVATATAAWGLSHRTFQSPVHLAELPQDTSGFLAWDSDKIVLAFRGTESMPNWITNAQVNQLPGPWGLVHRGFLLALESVWPQIDQVLTTEWTTGRSLWITGHSLGGALATLAAARLAADDRLLNGLYTFGQPRVGDPVFAHRFDWALRGRAFRFINNDDLVTRVPPRVTRLRDFELYYEHAGRPICFDASGKLTDGLSWWQQLVDRFFGAIESLRTALARPITDHDLELYVQHIAEAAGVPHR